VSYAGTVRLIHSCRAQRLGALADPEPPIQNDGGFLLISGGDGIQGITLNEPVRDGDVFIITPEGTANADAVEFAVQRTTGVAALTIRFVAPGPLIYAVDWYRVFRG